MKIWIDADACPKPVKELIFKGSFSKMLEVILVANGHIGIPVSPLITFIQVDHGDNVADLYIADHVLPEDLVITADIPLASLVVNKGAMAINPRGETYTEENISERLSIRDFMQDLRDGGVNTGGPKPYGQKDKELFANAFNRILTKLGK